MFVLDDDEKALAETARSFADELLTPHALEWDERKHFPVDVLRKAGSLGLGGSPNAARLTASCSPVPRSCAQFAPRKR